jgi:hypothetical protein
MNRDTFLQLLFWLPVGILLSPLLAYLIAKMVTLGIMRAKKDKESKRSKYRVARKDNVSEEELN